MRDAFGGVFMMRLMLVFIVVFVGFGAISLNYAKAFRIKNKVIDLIEQQEIKNITNVKNYTSKLDAIVTNADYNISCNKEEIKNDTGKVIGICYKGIVITENNEHNNSDYIYYDVLTYGGWNLNFLNMLLALGGEAQNSEEPMHGRWKITGEAKVKK